MIVSLAQSGHAQSLNNVNGNFPTKGKVSIWHTNWKRTIKSSSIPQCDHCPQNDKRINN